ncbi:MAG: hypothetical protein M1835_000180 [Candelina submexicana]|nr:MAG: hypothetical protein M1835_000180 [Candelina submexicana]
MATPPSTSKPPKTMSSRLLTMKFMQRAAAAASTPTTSTSTPSTEPSPKRQKLSVSNTSSAPSSDLQAVRAAVAAEEAVRSAAIERQAAEAGETRWVLSFLDGESNGVGHGRLRIINDGYSGIDGGRGVEDAFIEDGDEAEGWREKVVGRRSFGRFNRALEKTQPHTHRSSSPVSSTTTSHSSPRSSRSSSAEAPTPSEKSKAAARLSKKERIAKHKEAKALATKRKSKEVKLNTLTSISGGGNLGKNTDMTCFKCGQKGHAKSECRHSYNGQSKEERHAHEHGDAKVKKRKRTG